jgi:uncharacterized protein YjbI with pentapeptide repeats
MSDSYNAHVAQLQAAGFVDMEDPNFKDSNFEQAEDADSEDPNLEEAEEEVPNLEEAEEEEADLEEAEDDDEDDDADLEEAGLEDEDVCVLLGITVTLLNKELTTTALKKRRGELIFRRPEDYKERLKEAMSSQDLADFLFGFYKEVKGDATGERYFIHFLLESTLLTTRKVTNKSSWRL